MGKGKARAQQRRKKASEHDDEVQAAAEGADFLPEEFTIADSVSNASLSNFDDVDYFQGAFSFRSYRALFLAFFFSAYGMLTDLFLTYWYCFLRLLCKTSDSFAVASFSANLIKNL